jgi:molybdate transport system substrate-binding protein
MSRRTTAVALAAALSLAGCVAQEIDPAPTSGAPGALTVYAAASLTESFTELGADFEAANPGVKVTFNFAGSSALAQQINSGAPADVFASASPATMKQVGDAGKLTGSPITFAKNVLEIVVPKGNPAKVTGLADFGKADLKIALCAEQVPCGAAARKVFEAVGVTAAPDTLEQDVKAVLTKVKLGEVDAALVYRTDVRSAGAAVEGIEFPEAAQAVNDYPVAPLAEAPNTAAAKAFVDFVLSAKGRGVLSDAGFAAP